MGKLDRLLMTETKSEELDRSAEEDEYLARTPSGSSLNLTGAAIKDSAWQGEGRDAPSIVLPNQEGKYVTHIAVDIGGSLIKLVYFSPDPDDGSIATSNSNSTSRGGRLHFVKFETGCVEDCLNFIQAKGLDKTYRKDGSTKEIHVKATGGGAHKYADLFKQRLGLVLNPEDEMSCLVSGCTFLLKAIYHEAFTIENGATTFVPANSDSDLYPYLLVNIGSGVSMLKVERDQQFQRVSGSSLGGGTFWGLASLLTKCRNFDQIMEMCGHGNNANVDMLVGDIYGGRDYESMGLSATTIASSFGKAVSQDRDPEDYDPADLALALLRMIAYNIGHLAFLNAKRYDLKQIYFGGFFIRGHTYTMETISYAIRYFSKGEMEAKFLRHEGFLGAVGAFLKVHPMTPPTWRSSAREPRKVRSRFVERFSMGAPYAGGEVHGPAIRDMSEKVSWVEKFVQVGSAASEAARSELHPSSGMRLPGDIKRTVSLSDAVPSATRLPHPSHMNLHVGVLHYSPSLEPFPLLADPTGYTPNTIDINGDEEEYRWWLKLLEDHIPTVIEKAIASEGGGDGPRRRALAFGRAFGGHISQLRDNPGAYGEMGLSELFEMREECLREFGFMDVYRSDDGLDKERENAVALQVLPDLLKELDQMSPDKRLLALVEGILAANIFDWGAKACVSLYRDGTILDIYKNARDQLGRRPWAVDQFDDFRKRVLEQGGDKAPFRRVMLVVDNAGADVVLGMLPFAREFLKLGCEVVMAANSLPAINDITAPELRSLLSAAAETCPILKAARKAGMQAEQDNCGTLPPFPGLPKRNSSNWDLYSIVNKNQDKSAPAATPQTLARARSRESPEAAAARDVVAGESSNSSGRGGASEPSTSGEGAGGPLDIQHARVASASNSPKLYVVHNGQGSPCLDFRRVPGVLADATVGVDLLVLEGMGRAVHTNLNAAFKCATLKLAMIKTEHLARRLFNGSLYDCICIYEGKA